MSKHWSNIKKVLVDLHVNRVFRNLDKYIWEHLKVTLTMVTI